MAEKHFAKGCMEKNTSYSISVNAAFTHQHPFLQWFHQSHLQTLETNQFHQCVQNPQGLERQELNTKQNLIMVAEVIKS